MGQRSAAMKFFSMSLFYGLFLGSLAFGQNTPSGGDDIIPGPKGGPGGSIWTTTSPETQVMFGILDGVFLAAAQLIQDPEFRKASWKHYAQQRRVLLAKSQKDKVEKNFHQHEINLQELQAGRISIENELKTHAANIESKRLAVFEAQNILTTAAKEAEITRVKRKLETLHGPALENHNAKIDNLEDIYANHPEFPELKREFNNLIKMPQVNNEMEKKQLIKERESDYVASQRARDVTTKNLETHNKQIAKKTSEIDQLRPQLVEVQTELKLQQDAAVVTETFMNGVAARKGMFFKKIGRFVGRWGLTSVFLVDVGGRVYYYYHDQDPGVFPFLKIFFSFRP